MIIYILIILNSILTLSIIFNFNYSGLKEKRLENLLNQF